jgi:hypothetical protein
VSRRLPSLALCTSVWHSTRCAENGCVKVIGIAELCRPNRCRTSPTEPPHRVIQGRDCAKAKYSRKRPTSQTILHIARVHAHFRSCQLSLPTPRGGSPRNLNPLYQPSGRSQAFSSPTISRWHQPTLTITWLPTMFHNGAERATASKVTASPDLQCYKYLSLFRIADVGPRSRNYTTCS